MEQTTPATSQSAPQPSPGNGGAPREPAPVAEPPLAEAPAGGFFAASLDELRRVVWPSRQQLFSESVAVILMVGLSAAAIAAIDRFYHWVSLQVFR